MKKTLGGARKTNASGDPQCAQLSHGARCTFDKISRALLYAAPFALFFSYHPVISLGQNASTNFEFSLAEIWLISFCVFSLPRMAEIMRYFGTKKIIITSLIPVYFSLSIIWSDNRLRTVLTAGILWLLVYAGLNIIYDLKKDKILCQKMRHLLLLAAAIFSAICWAQCILDVAGVSRDVTLLCQGCVATTFGFPHPNGFAIEPQFMGNLLIAPALLCYYMLSASAFSNHRRKWVLILLTLFISATVFLTFSRGAIYAFIIGLILQQILLKKKSIKKLALAGGLVVFAFAVSLVAQGVFSAVGPTTETFSSGVAKSIHQLSLGKIDLRAESTSAASSTELVQDATSPDESSDVAKSSSAQSANSAQFSGYVAESTDVRLNRSDTALKTWLSSPQYTVIGTGLGAAGVAMSNFAPEELGPKEIVQNEYVSILLETGIVGAVLVVFVAIYASMQILRADKTQQLQKSQSIQTLQAQKLQEPQLSQNLPLLLSTVAAFGVTLLFFSGLPNALHLYIFPLFLI